MGRTVDNVLEVLDACCDAYTFPMLDNGYVYLAATRLSLFRSPEDWAMVIEVFGYSPRSGLPDTHIHTFASRLHDRDARDNFVNDEAYERYLANHPHNESRFVHPLAEGDWQHAEDSLLVASGATEVVLRGRPLRLPGADDYAALRIERIEPPSICIPDLCRYLAVTHRDDVLATAAERRVSVRPEMVELLRLEAWNHPDVVNDAERPSGSAMFQELAKVLETGDVSMYRPSVPSNTDWRNWPGGGAL
jgi:hypothetical protein